MTVSRNEQCPCGSGKKYKKCCLAINSDVQPRVSAHPSPRFRFEAGSYGGAGRQYMSSVICYKQITPDEWRDHFCLVNPTQYFDKEDDASLQATSDLDEATTLKSFSGLDSEFAMSLKDKGYANVESFRRAIDQ